MRESNLIHIPPSPLNTWVQIQIHVLLKRKAYPMPQKLTTTINKISQVANSVNSLIIQEFHSYMQSGDCSERNQNNNFTSNLSSNQDVQEKTKLLESIQSTVIVLAIIFAQHLASLCQTKKDNFQAANGRYLG